MRQLCGSSYLPKTLLQTHFGGTKGCIKNQISIKFNNCERLKVPMNVSISTTQTAPVEKVATTASDCQPCSTHNLKLADKAHEDSILEEAKIIEV